MNFRWNLNARAELLWAAGLSKLRQATWVRSLYVLVPGDLRQKISRWLNTRRLAGTSFPRLPAIELNSEEKNQFKSHSSLTCGEGVNIFGYFRGQFGLAESARSYARALLDEGYPAALIDINLGLQHGLADVSLDHYIGEAAPHTTNLVFINPDYLRKAMDEIGFERFRGCRTVACWFWELPRIPDEWLWALEFVDEILVASEFVADALRRATDKPVMVIPLPLFELGDSGLSRNDFGLPADRFIFLSSFDFHSSVHRKNPHAAIEAFKKAFLPERQDVLLLIKTSNGHLYQEEMRELMALALHDERIVLRDQIIDGAHMRSLQRCCDAYLSLHRAEGFGLGLAESMLLGKPVIGTAWSGNLEFMRESNSCLVEFSLVAVEEGEYTHGSGMVWAQANTDHAASFMQRLVEDKKFRTAISRQAAEDVRRLLSPVQAGKALVGILERPYGGAGNEMKSPARSIEMQNKESKC